MNIRQFTFCAVTTLIGCGADFGGTAPTASSDDSGSQAETPARNPPPACEASVPSDAGSPATETSSDSGSASSDAETDAVVADSGSVAADSGTLVDSSPDTGVIDSGSSDTGSADTGTSSSDAAPATDTGTAKPVGTLVLHARLPRWGTSHTSVLKGFEDPMRSGGVTWGSALGTSTGTGVDLTISVAKDSAFVFNGFYDGDSSKTEDWTHSFIDATGTRKVAIWGTFNGAPIARPTWKSNGSGGYNLVVIAAPSPLISSTDEDGDGFPKSSDCNDSASGGQAFYPWQVEVPEDSLDFDCNGKNDPPRAIIRMGGVFSTSDTPIVHDVTHWGTTYSLSWNTTLGAYVTSPIELDSVPPEFYIQWGSMYDSTYDGTCRENATVQIYRDLDGTLIPVTLKVASSGGTCHRFATL